MIRTALILAAGFGTRLEPLTTVRAKPAIPLAGVPLIVRIIEWLRQGGVTKVVINLHHRPETITTVVGHGAALGVEVRYSWERRLLGSAGGPRHALALLDEDPFLVVNGDTLANVDVAALERAHRHADALVTLAVTPSPAPEKYGGVLLTTDGRHVERFVRPGTAPRHPDHFLGIQVAQHEAFASLADNEPAESVWGHYPVLMRRSSTAVAAHRCAVDFEDIGTIEDYLAATARRMGPAASIIGERCHIAPSAVVRRSVLWDDVHIGAEARVEGCVIADGVHVAPGAVHQERLLLLDAADPTGARVLERPLPSAWVTRT